MEFQEFCFHKVVALVGAYKITAKLRITLENCPPEKTEFEVKLTAKKKLTRPSLTNDAQCAAERQETHVPDVLSCATL